MPFAKSGTLTGTTVSPETLVLDSRPHSFLLTVINRAAAGSAAMWFTWGVGSASGVAEPTVGGDDCLPVPPDFGSFSVRLPKTITSVVVKVKGDGNAYTVSVTPTPGV